MVRQEPISAQVEHRRGRLLARHRQRRAVVVGRQLTAQERAGASGGAKHPEPLHHAAKASLVCERELCPQRWFLGRKLVFILINCNEWTMSASAMT